MTASHGDPVSLAIPPTANTPDPGAELSVIDAVLDATSCRTLIREADVDQWLTTTADWGPAANGDYTLPPRRADESTRPCRLVDVDERPRFAMLDDPILALRLFYRLTEAFPQTRDDAELAGLKPLVRCVRYARGEGTELHRDPVRETSDGQRSQLSVMLFLNEDFVGGAIEFPTLGRTITPRVGRAIVFPHGALHQDQPVERGHKWVLETEVFYSPHWQPYR